MKEEYKKIIIKHDLKVLNTEGYNEDIIKVYDKFQRKFEGLIKLYSSVFDIKPPMFYIKESLTCNAFAQRLDGQNIIGINQGYPILMSCKFTEELFSKILFAAFINEKEVSDAFAELYESKDFQFSEYMLDCSIQFTFHHEFRHVRQFDALRNNNNLFFSENFSVREFDFRKHIWEYDADKSAAHQVLLFAFSTYRKSGCKSQGILKCLLYCALSSLVITQSLFNFGLISQPNKPYIIKVNEFYTKKNWHPHPTVRALNLLDSFKATLEDGWPQLIIETQDLLNNSLGISKLYFDVLLPNSDAGALIFNNMFNYIDESNQYNELLHKYALTDSAIKKLIKNC